MITNIGSIPALGNIDCGGVLNFTYTVNNGPLGCQDSDQCSSSFTVLTAENLDATCPAPVELPACSSSADILAAYNAWVLGFTYTGGCNVITNISSIPALGNIDCGGVLNFTYTVQNRSEERRVGEECV